MKILILVVACLVAIAHAQSLSGRSSCSTTQYFDTTSLTCRACGTNQQADGTGYGCKCAAGYYQSGGVGQSITCTACGANLGATQDRTTCLPCDGTTAGFSATALDCTCASTSFRLVEKTQGGVTAASKSCVQCSSNSQVFPSVNRYDCVTCPDTNMTFNAQGACVCNTGFTQAQNSCIVASTATQLTTLYNGYNSITYQDVVTTASGGTTSVTQTSTTFTDYFLWAAYYCQSESLLTACNALGNLCVLQNYLTTSPACQLYQTLAAARATVTNGEADWPASLPWLYYSATADPTTLLTSSTEVSLVASFVAATGSVNNLQYVLSMYTLNGTWLGYKYLSTDLQLCPTYSTSTNFLKFGANMANKCTFNITSILDMSNTIFYDMYLVDTNNVMFPVPVLLQNMRVNGQQVNANGVTSTSRLTRRFFVYDNLSGKSGGTYPNVIRYPISITLTVTLQTSSAGRIYPPLMTILYGERTSTGILASTALSASSSTFEGRYTMSLTSFYSTATIVFAIWMVFAGIWWGFQIYQWNRRHHNPPLDLEMAGYALIKLLGVASTALFWFLFGVCAYWYLFFKVQGSVFLLLPLSTDLGAYVTVLILALVGKILYVLFVLYQQTHTDVFFIDWERSRGRMSNRESEALLPVSVWRTLFVTNEWNEIQTHRVVHLPMTLLVLLLILQGFGVDYTATSQPSIGDLTPAARYALLKFALAAFWFLILALVQFLWDFLIYRRYINDFAGDFVDLLSVSNISLVLLKEKFAGYYVHGRSVHSFADTDMKEMNDMLRREQDNTCRRRGLEDGSDVQTFELFITKNLREQYDEIYTTLMTREAQGRRDRDGMQLLPTRGQQAKVDNAVIDAYAVLNRFLGRFIEGTAEDHQYQIMEQSFLEKSFSVPPDIVATQKSVLFRDTNNRVFTECLFSGEEMTLLLFNILMYTCIDLATDNSVVAAVVTQIIQWVLNWAREYFGRKNLSTKTLVDERFLI